MANNHMGLRIRNSTRNTIFWLTTTVPSLRENNNVDATPSDTPAVLQMASDLDMGSRGTLVAENSTVLLVVGFVLGVVTVAVVVGLIQYYYCTRKSNAVQTVYQSEWEGTVECFRYAFFRTLRVLFLSGLLFAFSICKTG